MTGRTPPHNLDAEESLLGAMLLSRDACESGLDLDPSDFYKPVHGEIFRTISRRYIAREPIDVVTIADELDTKVSRHDLLLIQGNVPASANARAYAEIVRRAAYSRRVIAHAGALLDTAYENDVEAELDLVEKGIETPLSRVPAVELDELLSRTPELDDTKPWIIPGAFRRRERLVLTGAEGLGKSTLFRQICVMIASGLHPFLGLAAPMAGPRRVLLVDLQEDELDLASALKPLRERAGAAYDDAIAGGGGLFTFARPAGANLLSPIDRRWLEGLILDHEPELVAIGPVRKMLRATSTIAKISGEEAVDEVTRTLDDLRVEHDFALMLEAHAGHDRNESNYRIRGSSVWLDWPEFGLGMKPVADDKVKRLVELIHWRGDRHTGRIWPDRMRPSKGWPWRPDDATYERFARALDLDWLVDGDGTGQEGLPV